MKTPDDDAGLREEDEGETELVPLLTTPDIAHLMVIKSVLESAGIPFLVQGEEGLHQIPVSMALGFFRAGAFGAAVRVRRRDLEDAQAALQAVESDQQTGEDE
ncbi:MAG: DUF2007 domain-containing protein [Acidobacteriota bacterium]